MSLKPGDKIRLSKGMAIDGYRDGVVKTVNGYDIYVEVMVGDELVEAHRYPNEMEKIDAEPDPT